METFRLKVPSGKRIISEENITNNKYPLWQLICWITVDKKAFEKNHKLFMENLWVVKGQYSTNSQVSN